MHLTPHLRKASELGLTLTAITTLILAGCGGGGSSSSSGGSSVATTTTTVTPYKGMFTNGSVVLKDANGNVVSLISGGSINASGVASVTYPSNVAYPLTIEVSGTFLDETSGVGATGTISAGAPLRGLIPAVADAQAASGVPVTVVTELARTMLPASGFSAASAVAAITGAASSVLGSTYGEAMTAPVFNAQGQTSNITTLKLTALAHVINQQGAGANLPARLQNIASQLAAGSAVNAVIPQSAFNNALGAINGGASSVLPVGATPPTIPTFTLPSGSLSGAIGGSGGTVGSTPSITGFNPSTGTVGTTVTISGTNLGNFTPAPAVKFGTTTATVSSATATSIVVTVPAGLATGNSTITLSNFDGSGVVTVGTFNVTGGANAFPNEAITLPTTSRNAITTPTIAATDLSSVVGTYTGSKASYETNVLISDYTTGTTLNSCSLSFAADRTVTLTAGAHTYTQVIDGTNNDTWSPSLTAGEVNTGNLHAGPQTPGAGVTEIGITIGRGKVLSVMAEIVADPFTPFTPMTERLTCWMPINRTPGTTGAGWTQWLSFGSASDMPTTVTGTYIGSLVAANNVAAPAGATCQLVIATDGTMTFSTTGATTDVSFSAQIAGDAEDRVGYTDASNWNLRAKDYSNQINGTYNVITLQNIAGSLVSTAGQGTVRPVTSAGYSCLTLVKQ